MFEMSFQWILFPNQESLHSQGLLNQVEHVHTIHFLELTIIWCWQMFYKLLRSAGFDPGQDMLAGLDAGKEAWWINLIFIIPLSQWWEKTCQLYNEGEIKHTWCYLSISSYHWSYNSLPRVMKAIMALFFLVNLVMPTMPICCTGGGKVALWRCSLEKPGMVLGGDSITPYHRGLNWGRWGDREGW